ncbi:DUF58 domain-containing protein [Hathewaya limosa]|uniref:Uncharacterized protein (DUF58 family) n=1 Tax=Hathewaya limosa TaxID=1536 RepID=A0ABU0JV56_HATLI|nr:DUF58 domain-containing protein [Hathewaya limosa]MDQ0480988.1 uncharacterized protein (DUF58 family) [Hathewaya limosa]
MIKINIKFLTVFMVFTCMYVLIGGQLFNSIFYLLLMILIIGLIEVLIIRFFIDIEVFYKNIDYFVGDEFILHINLKNKTPLVITYVCILQKEFDKCIYVKSFQNIKIIRKVNLQKRGIYNIDDIIIDYKDIFNIWRVNYIKKINKSIKVYPKIINIEEDIKKAKSDNNVSNLNIYNKENNNLIREVRKYEIGDNIRQIHWKVSAKCGHLMIKNFEDETSVNISLFINLNGLDRETYSIYDEQIVSYTISIIYFLMTKGYKQNIFINSIDENKFYINDIQNFKNINEYFFRDNFYKYNDFIDFINNNINKNKTIIILSLESNKRLEEQIKVLRGLSYKVTLILIEDIIKGERYEFR